MNTVVEVCLCVVSFGALATGSYTEVKLEKQEQIRLELAAKEKKEKEEREQKEKETRAKIAHVQSERFSVEQNIQVIQSTLVNLGATSREIEVFIEIAKKESGLNNLAVGFYRMNDGSQFLGLFQIWTGHRCNDLFNPRANTICAWQIYRNAKGFHPWHVCKVSVNCNLTN